MPRLPVIALILFLFQACSVPAGHVRGGTVELTAGDHDRQVDVKQGQTVTVRLDANRTTGYTWLLPGGPVAKGVLEPLHPESRYDQKIDGIYSMGVGAIEVWEFKAVRPGEGVLRLEYRRPFEKGVEPLRVVDFPIRVKVP